MIKSEAEINGIEFELMIDKKSDISEFITKLAEQLNDDNVNVEDCIYKGKKKYCKDICVTK
jgi:hypothetical protein